MTNWRTATSRIDGRVTMNGRMQDRDTEIRRKGVRRTVWAAGLIAVALFLLSILSMLRA